MPVVRKVRLRHVCGDLGPFDVESTARVETLAEQAYKEWPKGGFLIHVICNGANLMLRLTTAEGPMAVDPPLSPEEIGCIVQGKILSGSQDVESIYERYFGGYEEEEQEEDVVMTMHVVVRPPKPPSKHRSKKKSQRGSRSRQQGGAATSPSSSGFGGQCCTVM